MNLPQEIKITEAQWNALRDAENELKSIQQLVEMFQEQAKAKVMAVQNKAREVWGQLAAEHKLDLSMIAYVHDPLEPKIVPTSLRLRKM